MITGTIPISDLPPGGDIRPTDLWPALRADALVYKVNEVTGGPVFFANIALTDGQAVTMLPNGLISPAQADNLSTSNVIGFVMNNTPVSAEVAFYQTFATVLQTLTVGAPYYLSPLTAGVLVTPAPSGLGTHVCSVGTAVGPNTILININLLG